VNRALAAAVVLLAALPLHAHDDDAPRADPKIVAYALSSPERAWNFITAPESAYAERLAVAREAATKFPLAALVPRYFETSGVTAERYPEERPNGVHSYEVRADVTPVIDLAPHVVSSRSTGRPLTFAERARQPWQQQVSDAAAAYWQTLQRTRTADDWYAYARTLPCRSRVDVARFRQVVRAGAIHADVPPDDIAGAWRNLIRRSGAEVEWSADDVFRNPRGREAMAALLLLELVKRDHVYEAAFYTGYMTGIPAAEPLRDAVAYEAGRRILANSEIRSYERATGGFLLAKMYGDMLAPYDDTLFEAKHAALIAAFTRWFAAHEETLAARARLAAPAIAAAEARYTSELCK